MTVYVVANLCRGHYRSQYSNWGGQWTTHIYDCLQFKSSSLGDLGTLTIL